MTNVRFMYQNDYTPGAVIAASTENAEYAKESVLLDYRGIPWRSTAVPASITIDLGASAARTALLIDGSNLTAIASVSHRKSTDNFAANDVEVAPVVWVDPALGPMILFFSSTSSRYWRQTFNDGSLSYIEVSRLFLGTYFEPENNYNFGWSEMRVDYSEVQRNKKGVANSVQGPIGRKWAWSAEITSRTGLNQWRDFLDSVGTFMPFFIVRDLDNDPARETHFGRFGDIPTLSDTFIVDFTISGTFIEDV